MKLLLLFVGFLITSFTARAVEAGPYVLSGVVKSSDAKTLVLTIGEQEAEVPMKLVPASLVKDGKVETGKKVSLAFTQEQSKQIKIHKK